MLKQGCCSRVDEHGTVPGSHSIRVAEGACTFFGGIRVPIFTQEKLAVN